VDEAIRVSLKKNNKDGDWCNDMERQNTIRDFKLFHVNLNRRNCPSDRCASAAYAISRDTCIFNGRSVLIICYQSKS
jgi:hypothetical protein